MTLATEPRYPSKPGVARISTSSLNSYLMCALRYRLSRQDDVRRATVAQAIGTSVASAAESDNESKRITKDEQRLPLADLVEIAAESYRTTARDSEMAESRLEIASGLDETAQAAAVYGTEISPKIAHVVAAETRLAATLPSGVELVGTPDVVTADGIRDTKTGKPWDQARADGSRQLTAYDLLCTANFGGGDSPRRLAIDSLTKRRGRWTSETIVTARSNADRVAFLAVVESVTAGIAAGVDTPAPEGSWYCSEKWCEHWARCPVAPRRRG